MIHCGIDLTSVKRFEQKYERAGTRFIKKFLLPEEIELAADKMVTIAGFFAVKEAVAKALGSGIWQDGVTWHDIRITKDHWGKPQITLSGRALQRYRELGGQAIDVSISHEGDQAIACCVILCENQEAESLKEI